MRSRITRIAVALFGLLFFSSLLAEPANVLVGDLTFIRPENWTWQEPPSISSAISRFVIKDDNGKATQTDVRFYIMKKSIAAEKAALLHTFPDASERDIREEETKVGKEKITYLRVAGTYKFKDNRPKPDQLWVGAMIPSGKQFVYARIQGPRTEAQSFLPIFKQMVETAVRERNVN